MSKPHLIESLPKIPVGYENRFPLPTILKMRCDPMFDYVKDPQLIVEVGSCWGWFAYRAATQCTEATIYCIDPWLNDATSVRQYHGGEKNFWDWSLNVKKWLGDRVIGLRGVSNDFMSMFEDESVDLCFIDADHHREAVYSDCMAWWPKIRDGGVLVGHDIRGMWRSEVLAGVTKAFGDDYEEELCYWGLRKGRKLGMCWLRRKTAN